MKIVRITVFVVTAIACLSLISCGRSTSGNTVVSVRFSKVQDAATIHLSEWVGEPEFIALGSDGTEAYTSGGQYCISDNYIGIGGSMQYAYKLYDRKTGKFLHDIGYRGRGPREYLNTYSSFIDEKSNTVYLLPWDATSVLAYSLDTGDFMTEYPLKYSAPKGRISVDSETGDITVSALPFKGIAPVVAWKQDKEGNILWEIPAGDLSVEPDYSHEIFSWFNTDDFDLYIGEYARDRQDSLYVVRDGMLKPLYTVDFGTDDMPVHTYVILPEYFLTSVSIPLSTPERRFSAWKDINIVTDRKTGMSAKAAFYDDYMCEALEHVYFQQGYYIKEYSPDEFIRHGRKAIEKGKLSQASRMKIAAIIGNLSPDSNSVMVLAPLKR